MTLQQKHTEAMDPLKNREAELCLEEGERKSPRQSLKVPNPMQSLFPRLCNLSSSSTAAMKAIFFVILFVHSSSIIQSLTALKNHIPVRRCEVYNKRMHSSKPKKKIKLKCKNLKLKGKLKSHNQKSSNTAMLELNKKTSPKKEKINWWLGSSSALSSRSVVGAQAACQDLQRKRTRVVCLVGGMM